jgi:hypothetical protein
VGFCQTTRRYNPEDRTFLRNVSGLLPNYTAIQPRRSCVLPKRQRASTELHGDTTQKIVRFSETSAGFYRTTRQYNPEDRAFLRNVSGLLPNYTEIQSRRSYVPTKRRWASTELHGDTTQKIVRFSETSAGFYRTTRRYNPEDRTLHNHRCENLKCKQPPHYGSSLCISITECTTVSYRRTGCSPISFDMNL